MKISTLSEKKVKDSCKKLKGSRERAVRDVGLGGPKAESVINCFRRIESEFEDGMLRLDDDAGNPVLLILEFTAGGIGIHIWPVMLIASEAGLLLKAWFDSDGHAHILANYGTYSNEIKFASAEDLSDWILEYLRLQS